MKLRDDFVFALQRLAGALGAARSDPRDEVHHIVTQRHNFFFLHIQAAYDVLANAKSQFSHIKPLSAKPNLDFALVFEAALACYETHALKALHQWRQGAGIKHQSVANLADIQTVFFPQNGQHDVLRVRQPQRSEPLAVSSCHRARRRIEGETQLIFQSQKVITAIVRHGLTFRMWSNLRVTHGTAISLRPTDLGLLARLAAQPATFNRCVTGTSHMKKQVAHLLGSAILGITLLATGSGLVHAGGDPVKGVRTFLNLCAPCHSVAPGRQMSGPSLSGIVGKKAGSVEEFERYSKALPKSAVEWNEQTLSAWLSNPQAMIPDSAMPMLVDDEQARADIVAYLVATQSAGAAARDDIPKPFDKTLDLKSSGPATRVASVTYCRDTYTLKMENGTAIKFWENNLRFKTDGSKQGPPPGKPVLVPGGQQGDRAYLIFAAPQDMSASIKSECAEPGQ